MNDHPVTASPPPPKRALRLARSIVYIVAGVLPAVFLWGLLLILLVATFFLSDGDENWKGKIFAITLFLLGSAGFAGMILAAISPPFSSRIRRVAITVLLLVCGYATMLPLAINDMLYDIINMNIVIAMGYFGLILSLCTLIFLLMSAIYFIEVFFFIMVKVIRGLIIPALR